MPLTYEHVGSKKPAKINTYMLTRAELLITLCYEIPCRLGLELVKECVVKRQPLFSQILHISPILEKITQPFIYKL